MPKALKDFRNVYVVGIGFHPYQFFSATPYLTLGLTAVREALGDAGIKWPSVESVYHGTAMLGMAPTRGMLKHLGATGIPMTQVENASASGSTAFRQSVLEVAAGFSEVSLCLGVDKPALVNMPGSQNFGIRPLDAGRIAPITHFALLAQNYMEKYGVDPEDFGRVAVKNSHNGALNPNAQKQRALNLDTVLEGEPLSGVLTKRQCCPIGEGGAAVIVASEEGIRKHGIDMSRAVKVLSSTLTSEEVYENATDFDAELTRHTTKLALAQAGVSAKELDVVELHDAFSVEELFYLEAMGIAQPGEASHMLKEGIFDIGGEVAVSPSGGLLSMGHPIGPTGVGQIAEITRQLRHEAGDRQQPNAKLGLAHMVGLGAVCSVHVLSKEA